jgi:autotransporter-associated beta strand protein
MRSLYRVSLFLLFIECMMTLPLRGDEYWIATGTSGSDSWIDAANWGPGTFFAGTTVWIDSAYDPALGLPSPGFWPEISSVSPIIGNLEVGRWELNHSGPGYLTIHAGGDLTVTGELCVGIWGTTPSVFSTITMDGGTLTHNTGGNFHLGWQGGSGSLIMTAGQLNDVAGTMFVGCTGYGSQGELNMSGTANAYIVSDMRFGDGEYDNTSGCSGSLTMSGNSVITHEGEGYVIFGQTAGCTGYLTMSDNAQFVGVGPGSRYITIVGYDGGTGTVTMTGNTRYESAELLVGQNAGSVGNVHVTDNAVMMIESSPDWTTEWWYGWEGTLEIGRWGGTGTVVFDGASTLDVTGRTNIGNGDNYAGTRSVGSLTLSGLASMTTRPGTMRNYGWVWNDGGDVYVGCAEWDNGANPQYQTQLGGSGSLTVKDLATANLPTGSMCIGMHSGTGTVVVSNYGVINCGGDINLGVGLGARASLSVNDSGFVTCWQVLFGGADSTSATISLSGRKIVSGVLGGGGTLATTGLYSSGSPQSCELNFNGGILQARANNANFIDFTDVPLHYALDVMAGGAYVDTNGFDIEIKPGFVDTTSSRGCFEKMGLGRLTLSGQNTYTGVTVVEPNGEFKLAPTGSLLMDVNSYVQPYQPPDFYTQILGFHPGTTPVVGGTVTLEGAFNLDVGGVANPQIGDWWLLVDVGSLAHVGYGSSFTVNMLVGGTPISFSPIGGSVMTYTDPSSSLTWEYTEATGVLRIVPEPSTLILLAIGGIGLLACGWRRRQMVR